MCEQLYCGVYFLFVATPIIPGMELFDGRDYASDSASGYECWTYIFDKSNAHRIGIETIDNLKAQVLMKAHVDPRKDRIVAYLGNGFAPWNGRLWRVPMHIGRVIKVNGNDIIVRSKFGDGDVFEHPIDFVPLCYGDYAKFVRINGLFDGY